MPQIINQQRKIKFGLEIFDNFAVRAVSSIDESIGKELTIVFVSDRKIKELNKNFRNKNISTDVLSFPYEPDEYDLPETRNFLGDIAISVETAARQAEENALSFELEIKQLILHGILHLCGYDHENDNGEMNARELKLRKTLKIN